jgi:transglutaminase-like putative cysteine protease
MRISIDANLDYHFPQPADVLLALEVAQMPDQYLVEDKLVVGTATPLTPVAGHQGIGRRVWTRGEGNFTARYRATVDVNRQITDLSRIATVPLLNLPGRVIHYLWPSRYCQVDKVKSFALEQFGGLTGGARVTAMAEWTRANLNYVPGCSDESTTAHDTFTQGKGICRDFAHVMISFARALDIPSRMVSAYALKLDPPDFHAVVEVYLDGGWYLVDPTGLAPVEGLVRIGVGRDATDISFMTIFGAAQLNSQSVSVQLAS